MKQKLSLGRIGSSSPHDVSSGYRSDPSTSGPAADDEKMRKARCGDGADRGSAIRAVCEASATYGCCIEALLETEQEATQNCLQSCGKWWTRTN